MINRLLNAKTSNNSSMTFVQSDSKTVWEIPASCRCAWIFALGLICLALSTLMWISSLVKVTTSGSGIYVIEMLIFTILIIASVALTWWGYQRMYATHILEINKDSVILKIMYRWQFVKMSVPRNQIESVEKVISYSTNIQAITRIELRTPTQVLRYGSTMDELAQSRMIRQIKKILWADATATN